MRSIKSFTTAGKSICTMVFVILVAGGSFVSARGNLTLAEKGKTNAVIILAHNATLQEKTAAEELQAYLRQMTLAVFNIVDEKDAPASSPAILVGPTQKALALKLVPTEPEAWVVKTVGGQVILCGGRPRGTLYAVYHFLEDDLGVRWWNPQEEFVPAKPTLTVGELDRHGRPAFQRRCINMRMNVDEPPGDGGAFMVRSRMNSRGAGTPNTPALNSKYGCDDGLLVDSRPWCAHTFCFGYVENRDTLIKEHPEYFALRNGKRVTDTIDMTNPALRDFIANKVRALIEADRAAARKAGRDRPLVYNLSKEDCPNVFSETPESVAIRNREGSESGVLLDFVNDQARRVRAFDPEVRIETLAYHNTEEPPKTLKAADNVIITLCDTKSILTVPVTDRRNKEFADKILGWSKKAKNIRIWDYGFCFMPEGWEYPVPMEQTYRPDYQFFLKHNIKGIFTEFETPAGVVLGDMPDLKRWLIAKLMEDPTLDTDRLIQDFTDGYYGPAGKFIREYRAALAQAAASKPPGYFLLCSFEHTTLQYLDTAFIQKAKELFHQAEQACQQDPVLLRRVRHARASLDAAELMRSSLLRRQWQLEGKDVNEFPLNPKAAAERLKKTLFEQAAQRTEKSDLPGIQALADKIGLYAKLRPAWPLPEQFKTAKAGRLYEYAPPCIPRVVAPAEVVADPDSECGLAIRLPWTDPVTPDTSILTAGIFQMEPMPTQIVTAEGPALKKKDIKGPGYCWYKVMDNATIRNDSKFYFAMPLGWYIQFSCDTPGSLIVHQHYDIWAKLKFTGPAFTKSTGKETSMVYLERVLLIKKGTNE